MNERPSAHPLVVACRALDEAMDRFDEGACAVLGVGRTDLRALNLLEDGPLTAGEVGGRLGLTSGSVTTLVDRLVRAGYVGREVDPRDRRRVVIGLRPPTWAAFARVYAPMGRAVARVADERAAHDVEAAIGLLRSLVEEFDRQRAALPRSAPSTLPG